MIPMFQVHMEEAAVNAAAACLRQPMIGEGAIVDQFERELGVFLALGGNPTPTLTTNSCTAALHLAVNVLKRRHPRSDGRCRFLASPLTCLATNMPLLAEDVDITWVDTDPATCNISLPDLQQKLRSVPAGSHGYDGILFVHWGGVPLDMAAFESIRTEYEHRSGRKLMVIEDCAHALGATYAGAPLGGIRNIGCFSFQSIKPVTTIDGGCLTVPNHTAAYATDPEALYEDLKLSRWFGLDRSNPDRLHQNVQHPGFKFHMHNVSAAIGIENLRTYPLRLQRQRQIAKIYLDQLVGVPGLRLSQAPADTNPSWQLFTIRVGNRDGFARKLKEAGIATSQVHRRNDEHDCMFRFHGGELPGTAVLDREMICIPIGNWLSDADVSHIVSTIRSGW